MRITVKINDALLLRAKRRAAEERRSLTSPIEEALALVVARPKASRPGRVESPVSKASGGVLPGIDLNRSSDLEEVMNAHD